MSIPEKNNLNVYQMYAGSMPDFVAGGDDTAEVCVPFDGEIVGVVVHSTDDINADSTFDFSLNGADAGYDLTILDGAIAVDDTGVVVYWPQQQSVHQGDLIMLTSNASGHLPSTTDLYFTWLLKR